MLFYALKPTDKKLRQICAPLTRRELGTKSVQAEIEQLLSFVYGQNQPAPAVKKRRPTTVGLSANQVGLMKQISVVDMAIGRRGYHDVHVLINPEIIWVSRTRFRCTEGCVNLPEIWGEVERSQRVKVRALDRSGNQVLIDATGLAAVLLQHEIDHLRGRLFIDHLDDPTKAQLVTAKSISKYNKRSRLDWPEVVDVSSLARPLEGELK